jgi:hypothetical protein
LLQAPSNIGDSFGSRMSGWLVPPVTGDYTFWIASDDSGEFWLSTDAEKANKVLKCTVPTWTDPLRWDQYSTQKSGVISLVAGQAYYYEVRSICGLFSCSTSVWSSMHTHQHFTILTSL